MSIADFIRRKKSEYREKQMQLMTEREEKIKVLKAEVKQREELRKTKQELRELKIAPLKEKLSGINKRLAKLREHSKGREEKMSKSPFFNQSPSMSNPFMQEPKKENKTKAKPKRVKIIEY